MALATRGAGGTSVTSGTLTLVHPPDDEQQPVVREIGNRTYTVAPVEPLDLDGVRTLQVGTLIWALATLALLPFHDALADAGRTWWIWTCLAGFLLGLVGLRHVTRRRTARKAGRLEERA